MNPNFNIKITHENMLEEEKRKFGGIIYEQSYRLATIKLSTDKNNKYNIYSFDEMIKFLSLRIDTTVNNLIIMFADLNEIYNMELELSKEDPVIMSIKENMTMSLGQLALAGKQLDDLLIKIKDKNEKIEIEGQEYCFIYIVIYSMLNYYMYIFNLITDKKYISKKFMEDMNHTIASIISEEFEYLRKYFKVIESIEEMNDTRILH